MDTVDAGVTDATRPDIVSPLIVAPQSLLQSESVMPLPNSISAQRIYGPSWARMTSMQSPARPAARSMVPKRVRSAGQASSPATAFIGRDAGGNTASYDASGTLIPNTVMDATNSISEPDSAMGLPVTMTPVSSAGSTGATGSPGANANAASQPLAQLQAWAATPTGKYVLGGALLLGAVGLIAVAMAPSKPAKSRRARANPSRRRRRKR